MIGRFNEKMIEVIKAYMLNGKLRKNELLKLMKNFISTDKEIISIKKRNPRKIDILEWFQHNWNVISEILIHSHE